MMEERDRIADIRDALDRRQSRRGLGAHRQLLQVYDGGSIPTTVPRMFLTRPVGIDVDEEEGATPSIAPDTSQTIPVLVLGPRVPVAGDNLLARVIGGRWVAGMQGGGRPCLPCGAGCIPETGLILSGDVGGPTHTMTWNGTNLWRVTFGTDIFTLTCDGLAPVLTWETFDSFETTTLVTWTSVPFHAEFFSILSGPQTFYVDE